MIDKDNSWEYAELYFVETWTSDGNHGPHLAIFDDGSGARLVSNASRIKTINFFGADGWIIDTFRFGGDAHNIATHINSLVMDVAGVQHIEKFSVQLIRRKAQHT